LDTQELTDYLLKTTGRAPSDDMFDKIDTNHSGVIEFSEFVALLEAMGLARVEAHKPYQPPDFKDIKAKFIELDKDKSGGLDINEVNVWVKKLTGRPISDIVFKTIDKDGSGKLDLQEFSNFLKLLKIEKLN